MNKTPAPTLQEQHAANEAQAARIAELEGELLAMANQLDLWARESREGGWSTHQVEPMRKKADELRRIAARGQFG